MVKICMLSSAHSPFDDRIYYREAISLKKGGYDVSIIAPWKQSEVSSHGIRIVGIPKPKRRSERFLSSGIRIFNAALAENADVYHFHDPDLIPWAVLLSRKNRRVIYDVHEYTGESILAKSWLPRYFRGVLSQSVNWIEKVASMRFSGIITVNSSMEALFRAKHLPVITIANYPPSWFIEKCSTARDTIIGRVVYVGALNRERGYETVIDTMKLLNKRLPSAHCYIIGPIERNGVADEYPRLDGLGPVFNIKWEGNINFYEVPAFLGKAQVCWIPFQSNRRFEYSEPIKLFEYMAAGCPIVASRLNFIANIIEQVGCGILVSPSDVQAHADAIQYLLTHPMEASEMGERGKKAVQEKYNWHSQEQKLLAFYTSVLSVA